MIKGQFFDAICCQQFPTLGLDVAFDFAIVEWLARYGRFWDESHERLDDLLAALQAGEQGNSGRGGADRIEGPS